MVKVIKDAFNDVDQPKLEDPSEKIGGLDDLRGSAFMGVGAGGRVFRVTEDGMWLGAEDFASAPFSVDMDGNITATTLNLSDYVSKTDTGQTLSGDVEVGGANVKIDGVNARILVNDGTDDRVLIGQF